MRFLCKSHGFHMILFAFCVLSIKTVLKNKIIGAVLIRRGLHIYCRENIRSGTSLPFVNFCFKGNVNEISSDFE